MWNEIRVTILQLAVSTHACHRHYTYYFLVKKKKIYVFFIAQVEQLSINIGVFLCTFSCFKPRSIYFFFKNKILRLACDSTCTFSHVLLFIAYLEAVKLDQITPIGWSSLLVQSCKGHWRKRHFYRRIFLYDVYVHAFMRFCERNCMVQHMKGVIVY